MAKFTPKPWSKASIRSLLRYGRKHDGPWDEELEEECFMPNDEDASLVAAAPQMYEALKGLLKYPTLYRKQARDALNEAEREG